MTSISIVVIGLNEELNLRSAIKAIFEGLPENSKFEIIYVDSGSKDKSLEIAASFENVKIFALGDTKPSAAKGRNLGISHATGQYIQLVDGDSIILPGWLKNAANFLDQNKDADCVFGHIIEIGKDKNVYTRACSFDWHIPPGEYRLCGGNSMWRRETFENVGLFDEHFALGEEPDFCYRVRQKGGHIYCIDHPMVEHDLDMNSFYQYWKRAENSGKAYVHVAARYWRQKEKLWLYESLRNFVEPSVWVLILVVATWAFGFLLGLICLLGWWILRALQISYRASDRIDSVSEALLYGFHSQFARLPVFVGQVKALAVELNPLTRGK